MQAWQELKATGQTTSGQPDEVNLTPTEYWDLYATEKDGRAILFTKDGNQTLTVPLGSPVRTICVQRLNWEDVKAGATVQMVPITECVGVKEAIKPAAQVVQSADGGLLSLSVAAGLLIGWVVFGRPWQPWGTTKAKAGKR